MFSRLALGALLALVPLPAGATVYYVAAAGTDTASGTSEGEAWQTLSKVNGQVLLPGDQVLFEGGQSFNGSLTLDERDAGDPTAPVVFSSFGSGTATLIAGSSGGFYAYNTAGITLTNLTFLGAGADRNTKAGVEFYTDLGGATRLEHVYLESVEVSGFRHGILLGGWNGSSGFDDVRVTDSSAHDNQRSGLTSYAESPYGIVGLYVSTSDFYDNLGDASFAGPSGGGVMLGQVSGAKVERSRAWGNGGDGKPGEGAAGFWVTGSTGVTLQRNESFRNQANGTVGGAGFALDAATAGSVVQYSYAHDNDGAGVELRQGAGAEPWGGNVVRYTISENDGRQNGYGAITAGAETGALDGCDVYGNTLYISPSASGTATAAQLRGPTTHFRFLNNLFVTASGVPLLRVAEGQSDVLFAGNDYWSSGAAFLLEWGADSYSALPDWALATGQETVGGSLVGLDVDPRLTAPGRGGAVAEGAALETLEAYQLQDSSPVVDVGENLVGAYGIAVGERDFYGNALPQGAGFDLGAHERSVAGNGDSGSDSGADSGPPDDGAGPPLSDCGCGGGAQAGWLAVGAALVAGGRRRR